MKCPNCNLENSEGAKFCGKCGTTLISERVGEITKTSSGLSEKIKGPGIVLLIVILGMFLLIVNSALENPDNTYEDTLYSPSNIITPNYLSKNYWIDTSGEIAMSFYLDNKVLSIFTDDSTDNYLSGKYSIVDSTIKFVWDESGDVEYYDLTYIDEETFKIDDTVFIKLEETST